LCCVEFVILTSLTFPTNARIYCIDIRHFRDFKFLFASLQKRKKELKSGKENFIIVMEFIFLMEDLLVEVLLDDGHYYEVL